MTRVLDIGAGTAPHPRATDAVDLHSPRVIAAIARQERRRIPETVAYRYNVNVNYHWLKPVACRYSLLTGLYNLMRTNTAHSQAVFVPVG